ncbi:MAG TPA: hypothetical protein P5257_05685 [Bacteroidales bacterium]|nr:hypothetical protein [Bacteroidales bacterium]HRT89594.1 hypothetical protein [Bacteroidales bacterium]
MKRFFTLFAAAIIIISLTVNPSCRSKSSGKVKEDKQKEIEQVETLKQEIEKNVYPLPTSADVIKMLTDLEVGYIVGISNPASNAKKYVTSASKAVNLGIYGADLSYATLYNMQQQVTDYLDAIRVLATDLNMGRIYDAALYDSIKVHFDDRNILVKLLTDAFNDTYKYLSENDQQALALLVVGGAWVEGMYLTTHVSETAYNVAGISGVLLDQKKSFELFLDITKPYMNDPMISDFIKVLDPVKKVYEGLSTSLTEQNIKDITAAMNIVREKLIQ